MTRPEHLGAVWSLRDTEGRAHQRFFEEAFLFEFFRGWSPNVPGCGDGTSGRRCCRGFGSSARSRGGTSVEACFLFHGSFVPFGLGGRKKRRSEEEEGGGRKAHVLVCGMEE